jgi:hypothetical protein
MRTFIFIALMAGFSFADLSQSLPSCADPAAQIPIGSASFTDFAGYNSYDFYGSPLGLFEKENAHAKVDLGCSYVKWQQESPNDSLKQTGSVWNAPRILIGSPKAVYMQFFYAPVAISDNMRSSQSINLTMKRFGLTIAGQVPGGLLQLAFRGNGFVGNETLKGNANTRLLIGLDAVTVSVGSRFKETVAIGIEGGARAKLDTLVNKSAFPLHDRYFEGQLPIIGGFIEIKRQDLPVASAFSFSTGTSRFIYVTQNSGNSGSVDRAPIKGDSLAWRWQTIGNITNANITWHPSLFLGSWRNKYQVYAPTATNDNLEVGPDSIGHDWKIADFCFGLGSSMEIVKYATLWLEYAHSSLGLESGSAWPAAAKKDEGYHRIGLGAEAALHTIKPLNFPPSIETFVRIGYFNQRENSGIDAFQSERFGIINAVSPDSRLNRYIPDFGVWGRGQRIIGTTLGLGAAFLNRVISVDSHITFLSRDDGRKNTGLECGFNCGYCFK